MFRKYQRFLQVMVMLSWVFFTMDPTTKVIQRIDNDWQKEADCKAARDWAIKGQFNVTDVTAADPVAVGKYAFPCTWGYVTQQ